MPLERVVQGEGAMPLEGVVQEEGVVPLEGALQCLIQAVETCSHKRVGVL